MQWVIFVYVKHVSLYEKNGRQAKATIWNAPIWAFVLSHEMILSRILSQVACSSWEHCKTRCWFGNGLEQQLAVLQEYCLCARTIWSIWGICPLETCRVFTPARMRYLSWFPRLLVLFCVLNHIDSTQLSLCLRALFGLKLWFFLSSFKVSEMEDPKAAEAKARGNAAFAATSSARCKGTCHLPRHCIMLHGSIGFGSSVPGSIYNIHFSPFFQFDESKFAWHILHDGQGSSLMLIPAIPSIGLWRRGVNEKTWRLYGNILSQSVLSIVDMSSALNRRHPVQKKPESILSMC